MSVLQPIRKAAIIGAGQMGLGIAYVSAVHAKIPITIHDPSSSVLSSALDKYKSLISRDVSKSRLTQEQADEALGKFSIVQGDGSGEGIGEPLKDDVDLVIEAIPEIPELKLGLFKRLGRILPSTTILGSNTSSISITKLSASAGSNLSGDEDRKKSSERVIGIHYFNPVPQMKLVEIIPALQTSQNTIDRSKAFGKALTTSSDSPGFIANAILMPMINEAIIVLEKGIATPEDIDTTFRLGMGHPMGPLTLADLIGLDTCLNIQKVLHNEFGDSKYRPSNLLIKMVDAGWIGKKIRKGFYEYDENGNKILN
uniref:3-hydroxybutyryl-CoA dehydrogenase n=1 Tax=Kwoniella pini CBS 10737 TaxID=1296096 RepID=A0A1B9I1J2_9TREE|nr:3-hydroxybutyryl-CoA dehydrogenase [Kwoniella pini CBS 10737]OCF49321.1 3-hydroxybutyryl-CoA dehydrogenase [Kwoniella pini CBS 10737]